jgi:hypothetical protein
MKSRLITVAACLFLASCGMNRGVVSVHNASPVAASVDVRLSSDAAGRELIADLSFANVPPGAHIEREYTVDTEYYMSVVATLVDGTQLHNDYGYVLDEEWHATRQDVTITPTSILVNDSASPAGVNPTGL